MGSIALIIDHKSPGLAPLFHLGYVFARLREPPPPSR
jgi:hypothetical protein